MKKILLLLFMSITIFTHNAYAQWVSGDSTDSIAEGKATLLDLQKRYDENRSDCGTANRPAFLCSGVLIRVTTKSDAYKVWNPSPHSVSRGSVSFSFLRRDNKFRTFAWANPNSNGYIIYPKFQAPNKLAIDILCAYPNDSWEWYRDVPCGSSSSGDNGKYAQQGRLCSEQGITTAEQWAARWNEIADKPGYARCGFDVNQTRPGGAAAFMESLKAKKLIGSFDEWNELQAATWPQNAASELLIQAFFYTSPDSLADAQANQREFYAATQNKIIVPIVNVKLPATLQDDAVFSFNAGDQSVVGQASSPLTIDMPPIIDTPVAGSVVTSPFTVSGKGIPGAIIQVMTSGGARLLGQPVADTYGNWYIENVEMTNYVPITARQLIIGRDSNWATDREFSLNNSTCPTYIESASWTQRYDPGTGKNEWTLSVTPTTCGRAIGADKTDAAYRELVQKFNGDYQWKDNDGGGMRRQFVCHLVIARMKATWNLEPFRPNVTHDESLAAGCNPTWN